MGTKLTEASILQGHKALTAAERMKFANFGCRRWCLQRTADRMYLLDGVPLPAGSVGFRLEPADELQGKRIELARADLLKVPRLVLACAKVLEGGVAREARATSDLPGEQVL